MTEIELRMIAVHVGNYTGMFHYVREGRVNEAAYGGYPFSDAACQARRDELKKWVVEHIPDGEMRDAYLSAIKAEEDKVAYYTSDEYREKQRLEALAERALDEERNRVFEALPKLPLPRGVR